MSRDVTIDNLLLTGAGGVGIMAFSTEGGGVVIAAKKEDVLHEIGSALTLNPDADLQFDIGIYFPTLECLRVLESVVKKARNLLEEQGEKE